MSKRFVRCRWRETDQLRRAGMNIDVQEIVSPL
jgi:hypothetical protein